jgi:von Willebrand factor type A domain-containing protein
MINDTYSKLSRVLAIAFLVLAASVFATAQQKPKTSYGLLLDSTGSMRSQFDTVLEIGRAVVHEAAPHGSISIFNFASEGIGKESKAVPVARIEQSQDEAKLNRTIDDLYIQGGQTTLLDAIQLISDRLQQWTPDSQKVIVVVSDGEDRVSKVNAKELIQQLKDRKIKIFAVGLVRELESGKRDKARKLLNTLAQETGGVAVIPDSKEVVVEKVVTALGLPVEAP